MKFHIHVSKISLTKVLYFKSFIIQKILNIFQVQQMKTLYTEVRAWAWVKVYQTVQLLSNLRSTEIFESCRTLTTFIARKRLSRVLSLRQCKKTETSFSITATGYRSGVLRLTEIGARSLSLKATAL